MAESNESHKPESGVADVKPAEKSNEKSSLMVKAVSAVFATVLAPVLVALGMKFVDRVAAPPETESKAESSTENKPVDRQQIDLRESVGKSEVGDHSSADGAARDVKLAGDWYFHQLEPGKVDSDRFLIESESAMTVSSKGPSGVLYKTEQYDNFELSLSWRYMEPVKGAGQRQGGVIIRSEFERWPDNRLEVSFASGRVGSFLTGSNVAIKSAELDHAIIKDPADWHTMTITCQGDTVSVTHNGVEVSSGVNFSRKTGRIGIVVQSRALQVRDFHVKPLHKNL